MNNQQTEILKLEPYGKHLIFCGTNGSGKTFLAKQMVQHYDRYFIIDTKGNIDLPGKIVKSPENLAYHLKLWDKIIYRPHRNYRNARAWNYVFNALMDSSSPKKKNERVILIDEVFHVGYGPSFPTALPIFATSARESGLSLWCNTQRPSQLPLPIFTEAAKIYVFYLTRRRDIKTIAEFSREDEKECLKILKSQQYDNSFIEIDNRTGTWKKFPKLHI